MARPRKHVAPQAKRNLSKFTGRAQKTDFEWLRETFPEKYKDKVFRLITDDAGGGRHGEYISRGWTEVIITEDMAGKDPRVKRYMRSKGADEDGTTVRTPVNPNNPNQGTFGILMMKPRELFEEEERAALAERVGDIEAALEKGRDQSGQGGVETYAADTGDGVNKGFRKDLAQTLA